MVMLTHITMPHEHDLFPHKFFYTDDTFSTMALEMIWGATAPSLGFSTEDHPNWFT